MDVDRVHHRHMVVTHKQNNSSFIPHPCEIYLYNYLVNTKMPLTMVSRDGFAKVTIWNAKKHTNDKVNGDELARDSKCGYDCLGGNCCKKETLES